MSFSLTAQTSSTGRPILCTYRPAVDNNEKSQKYYTMIASHADDFLGRNVCQSTKNICVRGECEVFLQVFVPNNRVLRGRGALLFGCIVSFFVHNLSASLPTKGSLMSHREGFIEKLPSLFNNFSRTTFDFQGPPTRKVNLRFEKTVHSQSKLTGLELYMFALPVSLHRSVHLS